MAVFDKAISQIQRCIELPPSNRMVSLHDTASTRLYPYSKKASQIYSNLSVRLHASSARDFMKSIRYKAVTGLIGLNICAYMLLNSRSMKTKSQADGLPRSDRHFIASRYNISSGRVWSIPLSLFNHGDSLLKLSMNCIGLALVGPAVEIAFGSGVLLSGFFISGMAGALCEVLFGNSWCRGSSAGVTGLFGMGAFANPYQMLSIWGIMDVRAASLAISIFGFELFSGVFASKRSEMAHIAHAAGLVTSIPILYYLRWFRRF
jgi:membrane associated rhomboid family serine protease